VLEGRAEGDQKEKTVEGKQKHGEKGNREKDSFMSIVEIWSFLNQKRGEELGKGSGLESQETCWYGEKGLAIGWFAKRDAFCYFEKQFVVKGEKITKAERQRAKKILKGKTVFLNLQRRKKERRRRTS